MPKVVAPWALIVQSSSHEPWEQRHREIEYETRLLDLVGHVHHVQGFVNIAVLLRQYVSPGELRLFVNVWRYGSPAKMFGDGSVTSFGKALPAFWGSLNDFLHFDGDTGGSSSVSRSGASDSSSNSAGSSFNGLSGPTLSVRCLFPDAARQRQGPPRRPCGWPRCWPSGTGQRQGPPRRPCGWPCC